MILRLAALSLAFAMSCACIIVPGAVPADSTGGSATGGGQGEASSIPDWGSVDTTPPVVDSGPTASSITATSATISWTTDEAATAQVEYGTTLAYGSATALNSTLETPHSEGLSGLSGDTTYFYRVRSRDSSGNLGLATGTFDTADNVAPVISGFALVSKGTTSADFSWTTDEPASSQVECDETSGGSPPGTYAVASTKDAALVTTHSHSIGGLAGATTYYCRALSDDASANAGTSPGEVTFTTDSDTPPPPGTGPDISALSVATPQSAHRVCFDSDSDGDCEGFKYRVKPPMDTSGWVVTNAGTNPTLSALVAEINSDDGGCEVVTFDGEILIDNNQQASISPPHGCVVIRGLGVSPNPITVQLNATPQLTCTSAGNDQQSYFVACGSPGTFQSWTGGYDLGDDTLSVADVSKFSVYSAAAPWGANSFVQTRSDASTATCPNRYPRQGNGLRWGNDAIHRVVGIVDADGAGPGQAGTITIDPPLLIDYDDELPDCGNFLVRPATLPVVGFENLSFSTVDGDLGCAQLSGSVQGCVYARKPFVTFRFAQGWVTDSEFYNGSTDFVSMRYASDVYLEGLEFHNPSSGYWQVSFQAGYIKFGEGTTSSALLNSYCHNVEQAIQIREGARGNVIAHNYCDALVRTNIFFHGIYAGPNLVEGNNFEHAMFDRQWGPNGPYNVTYRNYVRKSTGGLRLAMSRRHDGPSQYEGPPPKTPTVSKGTGDYWTHIGDVAEAFVGEANVPYTFLDDHNSPYAHVEYAWATLQGSWGTGNCATCSTSNLYVGATQPAGWSQVDAPPTLFEFEGRAEAWPPYWCQEGADFFDVSNSIGAFSPVQQKLPAETVLKDGNPCTPCGAGGSGC